MDPAKTGTGGDSPFIEPRRADLRIRVVFDKAVQAVDGDFADKDDLSIASLLYNGEDPPISGSTTPASVTQVDATTLDIVLTSTPYTGEGAYPLDQKRLTIELLSDAIRRPVSTKAVLAGDRTCEIRCLAGDVNQGGSVNTTDISLVRSKINAGFSQSTWLYDVNASGTINVVDMALVRNWQDRSVP